MSHWWHKEINLETKEYELGQLLTYEQPTPYIVSSTKYSDKYKTPVLTAGKSFIIGYTDEETGIYDRLPVIIFDDFTTSSKYVNFKFKVKSSAMKILTANTELVLPKYIFYRMQIINIDHSTHKRYWIQHYSKLKIQIPAVSVQEKIVQKIEELFSELDNSVEALQTIKKQLEVYRQAVLKEALSKHQFSTAKIHEVCSEIVDCPHSTPKWVEAGYLCLRTTNFKRGFLDLTVPNYVSKETFSIRNKRLIPRSGDVLYSREGSILGIACIIPEGITPCLGQRMMLLRVSDKLNNRFLMHYLNSPMVTNHVITTKGGTGSPHINVGNIKNFDIPIPSIELQEQIVALIEKKFSVCDSIEQTVDTTLSQAEALRQSILKKAFEGGLSE